MSILNKLCKHISTYLLIAVYCILNQNKNFANTDRIYYKIIQILWLKPFPNMLYEMGLKMPRQYGVEIYGMG